MSQYGLYYQDNLLMNFVAGPGIDSLLPVHFCGIHHINLATMEIYIQCPVEDVRVECDGKPVELHAGTAVTDYGITSTTYKLQPEQGA